MWYENLKNEWDSNENEKEISDYTSGSNYRASWICGYGHKWKAKIKTRVSGSGCPYCLGKLPISGHNDLAVLFPELAKEWNYEKNGNIIPQNVLSNSNRKVWWFCSECGYKWEAQISNRTRGGICPKCKSMDRGKKEKDNTTIFESNNEKLKMEWNYDKNKSHSIETTLLNLREKVWWKCNKGHEWEATVYSRKYGRGCPYCSNKKVISGYNDFGTIHPDLANEWNYSKNGELTPQDVKSMSNKKVWWMCKYGHEWEATISSRSRGTGCPICTRSGKVYEKY